MADRKEKALCIDTKKVQGDNASLVEVSDVNQEGVIQPKKDCFLVVVIDKGE